MKNKIIKSLIFLVVLALALGAFVYFFPAILYKFSKPYGNNPVLSIKPTNRVLAYDKPTNSYSYSAFNFSLIAPQQVKEMRKGESEDLGSVKLGYINDPKKEVTVYWETQAKSLFDFKKHFADDTTILNKEFLPGIKYADLANNIILSNLYLNITPQDIGLFDDKLTVANKIILLTLKGTVFVGDDTATAFATKNGLAGYQIRAVNSEQGIIVELLTTDNYRYTFTFSKSFTQPEIDFILDNFNVKTKTN